MSRDICRSCGGEAVHLFDAGKSGRLPFFLCRSCASLQTPADMPPAGDDGVWHAERCFERAILVDFILGALGVGGDARCLDWTCEGGLLTRMLRDRGYDFACRNEEGTFAGLAFDLSAGPPAVVAAFGHLSRAARPAEALAEILEAGADLVIADAWTYRGQGAEALGAVSGPTFLWGAARLAALAEAQGYRVIGGDETFVFYRPEPRALAYDGTILNGLARLLSQPAALRAEVLARLAARLRHPYRFNRDSPAISVPGRTTAEPAVACALSTKDGPIVVDGVFYQMSPSSGIARVWNSVLEEWSGTAFGQRVIVLDRGGTAPRVRGISYEMIEPHGYDDLAAERRLLQFHCDRLGAAAFSSTYYSAPLSIPSVMLVHDMIPEVLGWDLGDPMWVEKRQAIAYASWFVCVSENSRRDLLSLHPEIPPERTRVAHLGVGRAFTPPFPELVAAYRSALGLERDYFLFVGPRGGYKNAAAFFAAWRMLPEGDRPRIVFVGPGPLEPAIASTLAPGSDPLLLSPSDEELALLYGGAEALVMPSLYEGFGLPVIEAMACGCPVVASARGSFPEVAGEAALLIDPADAAGFAAALAAVREPAVRSRIIAAGLARASRFRWETMAEALRAALTEAAGRP